MAAETGVGRGRTIRFRLVALATVLAGLVLTASAVALVVLQRQQLVSNLDRSLEQRADTIAAALADGPVSTVIAGTSDEDRATQLVALDGTVLAATLNLAGDPPLVQMRGGLERQSIRTLSGLPLEDDEYRVLSRMIETPEGPAVLHVVDNVDDLTDTMRALTVALAVAVPVVVIVLAAFAWALVGRTLQPVEALRAEVADIGGSDPRRRVVVPVQDDEISRLAGTMNEMLARLEDASERQRRFVADASHELRTPLTRIRTDLEVDLGHPATADLAGTHRRVLAETVAMQTLVEDLLHLARADAGVAPPLMGPLDLDDIVLEEVARLRQVEPNVAVDARGVSAAHLSGERDSLRRGIRNLLSNAVRHARSEVTVTLREREGSVVFVVADDGPGVPEHARQLIFERFGRVVDIRTPNDGGTGLGLAITKEIVERHGGTIRLDPRNEEEPGARFVISMPQTGRPGRRI